MLGTSKTETENDKFATRKYWNRKPPHNSTFGFCQHAKKADPKKPKELSLPTLNRVLIYRKETEWI